jgi:hypothetical protein
VEQTDIADPHSGGFDAERREALQRQPDHLRVGGGRVPPSDRFDPPLRELARLPVAEAEHRAAIAEGGGLAPAGREVVAADGDGVLGTQAPLGAVRVLGHEDAAADVLARQLDEGVGGLEDPGLDPFEPLAPEQREQRLRVPRFPHGSARSHRRSIATAAGEGDGFRPRG